MLTPRDIGLALLVVFIWGVNFVVIKWGVNDLPPLFLTALRYVSASVPAVFFVKRPNVPLKILVTYSLCIGFAQFGLLFSAIDLGMPAGLSSLVMQLQAFFTIGLAMLFLGEKLNRFQALGAVIAFGGIAVIATERFEATALVPLLMCVAAAFFWGAGNIASKKAGKIEMLPFIVWTSTIPIVPLLIVSLIFEGPAAIGDGLAHATWGTLGVVLFLGLGATVVGYGLWSYLLARYPASTVAPFSLLVPVAGIGSAMLLLGESISVIEIWGSVLVFAGLLVNVFGPRIWARQATAAS